MTSKDSISFFLAILEKKSKCAFGPQEA